MPFVHVFVLVHDVCRCAWRHYHHIIGGALLLHRRSQGEHWRAIAPPRIQDWQSTKTRRLEGPSSLRVLVLCQSWRPNSIFAFRASALRKALNLSSQDTPKFTSLRSKTKKNFLGRGHPLRTPHLHRRLALAPQFDPPGKIWQIQQCAPRQIPGYAYVLLTRTSVV